MKDDVRTRKDFFAQTRSPDELAAGGARVTVYDNSPAQLGRDLEVATREGLAMPSTFFTEAGRSSTSAWKRAVECAG